MPPIDPIVSQALYGVLVCVICGMGGLGLVSLVAVLVNPDL